MTNSLRLGAYTIALAASFAAAAGAQANPRKQIVNPPANPGNTPLSAVVRTGNLLFLSGQLPSRGAGADTTIQGQTRSTMENIKRLVEGAGGTMEDIVKCTVFLIDTKDFGGMNTAYREFFPKEPPARSTVTVAGLVVPGAKLEIECIAAAR